MFTRELIFEYGEGVYWLGDYRVWALNGSFRSFLSIWTFDPYFHNCLRPWRQTHGANYQFRLQTFEDFWELSPQKVHLSRGPVEDFPFQRCGPIVEQPTVSPLWISGSDKWSEIELWCWVTAAPARWVVSPLPPPPAFHTIHTSQPLIQWFSGGV